MSVAASFVSELGDAMAQAANPSFDCAKARTQDEIVICNDSRLAELDQAIAIGLKSDFRRSQEVRNRGCQRNCKDTALLRIEQAVHY